MKSRREKRFWQNRMSLAQVRKNDDREMELARHVHLISDKKVVEEVNMNMNVRKQLQEEKEKKNKNRVRVFEENMEE